MVVRILVVAIAASLALATLLANEPAWSQTNYSASKQRAPARTNQVRPPVRGYDPDPFIQGEIIRHRNSGWPD